MESNQSNLSSIFNNEKHSKLILSLLFLLFFIFLLVLTFKDSLKRLNIFSKQYIDKDKEIYTKEYNSYNLLRKGGSSRAEGYNFE